MNLPSPSLGYLTAAEAETPAFVYALGHIEPRFPNATVAAAVVEALRRANGENLNGQQTLSLLSEEENRHLLRQLCWVLMSQGAPRYLLQLASVADFDALIGRFRSTRRPTEVDVVIGRCSALSVPEIESRSLARVAVEQLNTLDVRALIQALPRPLRSVHGCHAAAEQLFKTIEQMPSNRGTEDEHRALNYLMAHSTAVYANVADCFARSSLLTGISIRLPEHGARRLVDVVFSYASQRTEIREHYMVRVDVTEAFPFLESPLAPYFDRFLKGFRLLEGFRSWA
ncbi:MAG TPA: hypothetical protein VE911_02135 [Candidatus Nitrosopolaris sp.]|nr:hypothetical protein [Candidatus Nitrosopolaris sp.]